MASGGDNRSSVVDTVSLESVNSKDLSLADLRLLAQELERDVNRSRPRTVRVIVRGEKPVGAGNTWVDVLLLFLPSAEFIREEAFRILVTRILTFMRSRFRRPHERSRPRLVCIYGPDGSILKKVQIDSEDERERWDDAPADDLPLE
jgi:hypothetical protein